MFYVYSTLTCDNEFAVYAPSDNRDIPVIHKTILIKGGHGVAGKNLFTPKGVVTEVCDEDMEILNRDVQFLDQMKHGFITVEKKHIAPEKAAENMTDRDGSSPKRPSDYEDSEKGSDSGFKTYGKEKKGKK